MSRFKELGYDKLTIMMRLTNSQNLCKALFYNDRNFLDKPNIADPTTLIYEYIFPYKKIPDVQVNARSLITLNFSRYRPVGVSFKSGIIDFNVLIHKDNMRTDYGCLRTDYIVSEIDELINQTYGLGIGKVKFFAMDDILVNSDYHGITISYEKVDFN
ncbi:hypothetical protein A9X05_09065 [Mycobacterium sp. E3298]|nr:hypothetical protein A9X05_09065 [Mycobacterium sp. E3298]